MTDTPELLRTPEHSRQRWQARHDRFNPGPPTTKRQRRDRAHGEALIEDERRTKEQAA